MDRRNRDESIKILATAANLKPEDVAKSYDFFRDEGLDQHRKRYKRK